MNTALTVMLAAVIVALLIAWAVQWAKADGLAADLANAQRVASDALAQADRDFRRRVEAEAALERLRANLGLDRSGRLFGAPVAVLKATDAGYGANPAWCGTPPGDFDVVTGPATACASAATSAGA